MYPRNAASPEPIAIGAVIAIADGAVQTSGVTVRIKPIGVAEGNGAGTTAYSTDGIVLYTPTQAETNYTSFILVANKASCIPSSVTVITTLLSDARATKLDFLDVAISTRMATFVYTAPDNASLTTLTTRLSDARATKLDFLDVAISTRMATFVYTAPDNASLTTLTTRLSDARATKLDNLDVAVSTRSIYAGAGIIDILNGQTAIASLIGGTLTTDQFNTSYIAPDNTGILNIEKLLMADVVVDTTTNPWAIVWKENGTETELLRQPLRDVNGTAIISTTVAIGSAGI